MEIAGEMIFDSLHEKTFIKGKLLGKGVFTKCYELTNTLTNEVLAGKIIWKNGIKNACNRDKLQQEITIHKMLNHEHIVKFHSYFEDATNIYIVLELSKNRSLLELHKRRKQITEPETRYFSRQIARACEHLHAHRIIHRDLKLASIFLNEKMIVKLGDFGLATRLEFDGERKKTMSGTPNYIAPEVLRKEEYSYEVDSWSLGCIIYTMLVGKSPFETESLRDTYFRIKKNEYNIPSDLSYPTQEGIRALLESDASRRPSMKAFLSMSFFSGFVPDFLPMSALTVVPRWENLPLDHIENTIDNVPIVNGNIGAGHDLIPPNPIGDAEALTSANRDQSHKYLLDLQHQIQNILGVGTWGQIQQHPILKNGDHPGIRMLDLMEESEDPSLVPVVWVSKWIDYSDRYGLVYQLSDGSSGVVFNDTSQIILTANCQNLQYIERNDTEYLHTINNYPSALSKKVTLLQYFRVYMNVITAEENMVNEQEAMSRVPYIKTWFRKKSVIVLYLSNGTLQINFSRDRTNLVICPLMGAVTYIDGTNDFRTFKLQSLREKGMTIEMHRALKYAYEMIEIILKTSNLTGRVDVTD